MKIERAVKEFIISISSVDGRAQNTVKSYSRDLNKYLEYGVMLNDKKIDEQYYPKVDYGYTFRVIKDTSTSELYYVIQSIERAYLYGYSPDAQKLVTYIDSQNYAHASGAHPYIVALKNGDLILAFEQNGSTPNRARYEFEWDSSTNWFAYSDIGTGWPSITTDKQ